MPLRALHIPDTPRSLNVKVVVGSLPAGVVAASTKRASCGHLKERLQLSTSNLIDAVFHAADQRKGSRWLRGQEIELLAVLTTIVLPPSIPVAVATPYDAYRDRLVTSAASV